MNQAGGGTQLNWSPIVDADNYLVFRGEVGCDRQQVVIGTVPNGTTSFFDATGDLGLTRFYRVQAREGGVRNMYIPLGISSKLIHSRGKLPGKCLLAVSGYQLHYALFSGR